MLLKRLTLHNFGTYRGSQSFNLAVGRGRNVVLVGGKNGSGKSTFLDSVRLCLYGSAAFRRRLPRDKYEQYLLDRIHRDPSATAPLKSASIEVEFDHNGVDGAATYKITREWVRRSNHSVSESIALKRNGHLLTEVEAQHWQDFIEELLPLGVSDLYFFDGEKVQLLAEDGSDTNTLADAVHSLLGADIVEKLAADLSIYRSRAIQKVCSSDSVVNELRVLTSDIESLRSRKAAELLALEGLVARHSELRAAMEDLDREIQRRGGTYAKNRGRLEERRKQIATRVEVLESSLREHATSLLPLALAPTLLGDLLKQLDAEQDVRFHVVMEDSLLKAERRTLARLRKIPIKFGHRMVCLGDIPEFEQIYGVVSDAHTVQELDVPMIHELSGEQERLINHWAQAASTTVPNEVRHLGHQLEELYRERQRVERDLGRIPQDEVLNPLLERLRKLRDEFARQSELVANQRNVIQQAEQSIQKAEADYRIASDRISSAMSHASALDRVDKCQTVLQEYKAALVVQRIRAIEGEVTKCFELLSRKHLKWRIVIDPVTFVVSLTDSRGNKTCKSELSAGEKQIYAIAVLWALARVARRPAPIIIDTPLARLDSEHRRLLMTEYFPRASHQVIILSTDTEVDEDSLSLLEPVIASSYELRFDSVEQATTIFPGYFSGDAQR